MAASSPDLLYNWRRTGSFTPSPSSTGRGWRAGYIEQYGTLEENPASWDSIPATSYLSDLSGPIELHHGTADEDVPVEFSIRLAELGRQHGQIVNLYTYEGDNHNISNYFTQAMNQTIAFFDIYFEVKYDRRRQSSSFIKMQYRKIPVKIAGKLFGDVTQRILHALA